MASPTYKAAYTGLLKMFLDKVPGGTGLQDVVVVPLMLGGAPVHALAPELTLRPVLSELGATTLAGLFLLEQTYADGEDVGRYVARWAATVQALASVARPA